MSDKVFETGPGAVAGDPPPPSGGPADARPTHAAAPAGPPLSTGGKVWRWLAVAGSIYLLICAVSIIGRGFRALGDDRARALFDFAANPAVGLAVGVLATVIIQSSTTTTAITVAAVGTGAMSVGQSIPIILGANVGTTVTCTLVALGFVGNRDEFRRALTASTIHDFYNLLALAILFPLELIFHPLERISGALTDLLYGSSLPDPSQANIVRMVTRPAVNAVTDLAGGIGREVTGAALTIVVGIGLIFLAVQLLSRFLKVLMVGKAQAVLTKAVGGHPALALLAGTGVTVVTQSSTVTNSILVPFAGTGAITPKQIYPVTVGANLGTTFTALLAAFAVNGANAKVGLQAAFVHVIYNVVALLLIFVNPLLRPVPLWCAEKLADVVAGRKWVLAVYLVTVFILLPAFVIALGVFGVL